MSGGVCVSVAVWVRWTEGAVGGGAAARFIISRLIAPVQERSGSLGNRMPFSFNCQPPHTVPHPLSPSTPFKKPPTTPLSSPPRVLHQRQPHGPTPTHQQRRAAVSYCTRITGQRRMRGACTQRHLMAPEEAAIKGSNSSPAAGSLRRKVQIWAIWAVVACCESCFQT